MDTFTEWEIYIIVNQISVWYNPDLHEAFIGGLCQHIAVL